MHLVPDQLAYFNGVVEDRMDPSQMGRVRVRVIGLHPFKKTQDSVDGVPTEELPWMICLLPITSAAMDGISGSITGLVEGSHVFGLWLDKYRTNGIVLGATSGFYTHKPDPSEGFSDPNGVYPKQLGPTAAALAMGGEHGAMAGTNISQDGNTTAAINPEGAVAGGEETNTYSEDILKQILKYECKKSLSLTQTDFGWAVGYEHIVIGTGSKADATKKLDEALKKEAKGTITEDEAEKFFTDDIANTKAAIAKDGTLGPLYSSLNGPRKMALEVMVYQLGTSGVNKFENVIALLKQKKWADAQSEIKKTKWAVNYSPARANRVGATFRYGNLSAYGIQTVTQAPEAQTGSSTLNPNASQLEALNRVKNLIYGSSGLANAANAAGIPAYILAGLCYQESKGIQTARSGVGADGYFQFMPPTAREYGLVHGSSAKGGTRDLVSSGQAAIRLLKDLHTGKYAKYTGGNNWTNTLRAYNWGFGNVDKHRKGIKKTMPTEAKEYPGKVLSAANWFKANAR